MSKFTPGEWRWYWREEDGKANCGVFAEKMPGHAYAVARCPQYQKREQWEADARLISAAPDLLEAAHEALAQLTGGYPGDPLTEEWFPNTNVVHMLAHAIAKAESK